MAKELSPINIQAPKLVTVPGCFTLVFEVSDRLRAALGEWHDVDHPATDDEVVEWAMYVLQDDALTLVEDYNASKLLDDEYQKERENRKRVRE